MFLSKSMSVLLAPNGKKASLLLCLFGRIKFFNEIRNKG
ncbi:hypothetical protein K710_0491 [Streptococcus iniae SF1]|nr:hypothetical protein K710_0491 [Streptococcus iniae SF1]